MDRFAILLDPSIVIDTLIIGITNGSLIALIALGYTLVYGIIELINFAHGEVFMLGSAVSLSILLGLGASREWPAAQTVVVLLLTAVVAMIICAVLNASIERLAYRRLRNAPRLAALISAIGASFILQNVGLAWLGANPRDFPELLPRQNIFSDIFGIQTTIVFSVKDLIVLALTIPLMLGLQYFVRHTRLGKAMRATAQDRDAAALMGIDINLTITLTFLLGGALAGAAGLLFGLYSNYTSWQVGFRAGLQAFTAAVLGGIGNIGGAVLGAFIIGILGAFSDLVFDSRWTQVVIFSTLIVILVFRPSGLIGTGVVEKA
jgi:branched-chain amino acid transport system permease protein